MMEERGIYKQCVIIFFIGIIIIVSTGYLTISHALTMPAYKRLQPASINLKGPVSVAIDSNEWIYTTDTIHNKVNIYGPDGIFIKTLSGLNGPLGIAVDSTGRLFIGNKATGNVEVYDTDLSFLFKLGSGDGEFKRPCSIAIDSSDNIYVADCKDDRIKVYNPDGSFNFSFGGSGSGAGQFNFPSSIAIDDANSEIIVTDFPLISSYRGARIQIFNMSGGYKRGYEKRSCGMMWCSVGDGILVRPLGVAADGVGRIYVSDAYQGVVQAFESSTGLYIGAVYDADHPLFTPLGILFKNNRLYISSSNNSRVEVYTTDVSNPDIAPLYPSHDYGVVTVGESSDVYNFRISNIGGADLVIGSVNLTGADSGDFAIASDTCSGQILISSNNCTVGVVFSPSSGSTKNAFLNITSNDPDEDPLGIALSGTGNFLPVSAPGGPYSEVEGQSLTLDGSGSNDVDGTITLYEWDINNDGIYEYATTSATQTHTYAQQGSYTIRLRVTDDLGATAEETTTAFIADTSPTADFTASPTSGQAPLTVNFTNNSTGYDQPLTYEWDFDNDGIVDSTATNPSYTYTNGGQYTVSLRVQDADGSPNTLTRVDYINVIPSVYQLTVDVTGQGTVTSTPSGIICGTSGSDCIEEYDTGETVTLLSTPDDGWLFKEWSDDCTGTDQTCQVVMDTDRNALAAFVFSETFNWDQLSGMWMIKKAEGGNELVYSGGGIMGDNLYVAATGFIYSLTDILNAEGMEIEARARVLDAGAGRKAVGIVFAYDESSDLVYIAGADVTSRRWAIGKVDISKDSVAGLAILRDEAIEAGRWYELRVEIDGDTVRLYADDVEKVSYTFTEGISSGRTGVGGYGPVEFDEFEVNDGDRYILSDSFNWDQLSGMWMIEKIKESGELVYSGESGNAGDLYGGSTNFAYSLTDVDNGDGMSIEVRANMKGSNTVGGRNAAGVVFAYDETGIVYVAGADKSSKRWVIAMVDIPNNSVIPLASAVDNNIETERWYDLRVEIDGDTVRLYADDVEKVTYTFTQGIPAGLIGLAGYGDMYFDNLEIGYW
jgi:PKD repeat protein